MISCLNRNLSPCLSGHLQNNKMPLSSSTRVHCVTGQIPLEPHLASLLRPSTFLLGRYPMATLPMKGTRWCSQRENISMSLTMTISSWSSTNTASLTTSARGVGRAPGESS